MDIERLVQDLLKGDRKALDQLDPEERAYIEAALQEMAASGKSSHLELLWELDYHHKPVSHNEFFENDYYLGKIGKTFWPKWRDELDIVLDPSNKIFEWILAGSIGAGKTSKAVAALLYKLYVLTCFKTPAKFYGLEEGSPIIFAFFNIFKYLVSSTSFQYFENYCKLSPYFSNLKVQAKAGKELSPFTNNISIIAGASALHALGMNIFSGLLDEANFGKDHSQADSERGQIEDSYLGVHTRIESRFADAKTGNIPGLLCLVSSHRDQSDFLSRHIEKVRHNPHSHISSFAIYKIKPGYDNVKTFRVLVGDKERKSEILEDTAPVPDGYRVEDVPVSFRSNYEIDIDKALQDISGIATFGTSLLIPQRERVYKGFELSTPRKHPFTLDEIGLGVMDDMTIIQVVNKLQLVKVVDRETGRVRPIFHAEADRFLHIDLAKNQDAAGIAMACLPYQKEVVRRDPDGKLYTSRDWVAWVDFMIRVRAIKGDEIDYAKIRDFVVYLRDALRFKIHTVSADRYQSVGIQQELRKAGFETKLVSLDRSPNAYLALKVLHLEHRVDAYRYEPYVDELLALKDIRSGKKRVIDHPDGGSKDVSDCVAGSIYTAFETKGSELQPSVVHDPSILRRMLPQKPMDDLATAVIPSNYGNNPLAKYFKK